MSLNNLKHVFRSIKFSLTVDINIGSNTKTKQYRLTATLTVILSGGVYCVELAT